MSKIITECPYCSQKNRVDSDKIGLSKCGKCKKSLIKNCSRKLEGRIKYCNNEKAFGFIQDSNNIDYFFHISDVNTERHIFKNAIVDFEVVKEERGNKAVNVCIKNNITSYSKPKFININNERILLSKIKKYTIYSHTLHYRNDKPIPKPPKGSGFFKSLFFSYDERELYDEMTFNYLKILMFDGSTYRIYSDKEANRIYNDNILGKGYREIEYTDDSPRKERNNMNNKVVHSGKFMTDYDLEFSNEPISEMVDKLDNIFNSI